MRFIITHATDARWESGTIPTRELIARVGKLLGEMGRAGVLIGGEGLRATRTACGSSSPAPTGRSCRGRTTGSNELTEGFVIVRVAGIDQAVDWGWRLAELKADAEIDVRPVTEPWDIGMAPRPADVTTRRYMVLRKATPTSEAGAAASAEARTQRAQLIDESTRAGVHVVTETMHPSRRGRRYTNTRDGRNFYDDPSWKQRDDRWIRDCLGEGPWKRRADGRRNTLMSSGQRRSMSVNWCNRLRIIFLHRTTARRFFPLGAAPQQDAKIPLVPGLKITFAVHVPDGGPAADRIAQGDYEMVVEVSSVADDAIGLSTRIEAQDAAGQPVQVNITRRLPRQDIAAARLQILGFHTSDPGEIPGSTVLGPSLAILSDLRTTGQAAFSVQNFRHLSDQLRRPGPRCGFAGRFPVLVNGVRAELPAIRVTGQLRYGQNVRPWES